MNHDIIHCPNAAFDRKDVLYMTRYIEDSGEAEVHVVFRGKKGPVIVGGEDADRVWTQYINPPFQAASPSYIQSWPSQTYGLSSPTWPGPTDLPTISSGSLGNAGPSLVFELTRTAPVTLTGCSSYLDQRPHGSPSTDTTGERTSSGA